jgi:hypothetical protein
MGSTASVTVLDDDARRPQLTEDPALKHEVRPAEDMHRKEDVGYDTLEKVVVGVA